MNRSDKKNTTLMSQQSAVMSYLEDLLQEVPAVLPEDIPDNVVQVFPKQKSPARQETTDDSPEPDAESAGPQSRHKEIAAGDETENGVNNNSANLQQVPVWAEQEFQCLMFHVVGISLAVPLIKLNGVIPWNENLTPMPGHSNAFMGLLRHLGKNVKVMDTAHVILPPDQMQQLASSEERIKKIILMDEGRWGLACDDVGEVITLTHSDVRWRTAAGKRPWLAGTISERLCALLDTDVLSEQLSEGK